MKLQTPVETGRCPFGIGYGNRILVLGSCFADEAGRRMAEAGLDVCVNPFGTLYNPASLANALARLRSAVPFSAEECEPLGAGIPLTGSFSHHTSFARPTPEAFLSVANEALADAARFAASADTLVLTLGSAWCWRHLPDGEIVANCLRRDGKEFRRELLEVPAVTALLSRIAENWPGRRILLTVSPVRHGADGAHGNRLGKSVLLLAADALCRALPERAAYFPAYEIVMDELRDYRFYAEDMVHLSRQALDYIWERFLDFALPESDRSRLEEHEKARRREGHRALHPNP